MERRPAITRRVDEWRALAEALAGQRGGSALAGRILGTIVALPGASEGCLVSVDLGRADAAVARLEVEEAKAALARSGR